MSETREHRSSFRFSYVLWLSVLIPVVAVLYQFGQTSRFSDYGIDPDGISTGLTKLAKLNISPHAGCESIVIKDDCLYSGCIDGKVIKVDATGVKIFAQLTEGKCMSLSECGRPLGMRLSHDGENLLVADAYLGLFKIPILTGIPTKLFPLNTDFKITFFDDFDVLPNGTVILSEPSTKYALDSMLNIVFEVEPSGRILSIDPATGKWHEILSHMRFPNGVQLHSDGCSVLIAETSASRILRIPLEGGSPSVFAENLIGLPDNIRPSPRGGYWVPVSNLKTSLISKLHMLPQRNRFFRWLIPELAKYPWFNMLQFTKSTMLLRLDEGGKVVEALSDPTNSITNAAEVCEHDGVLYTGSYYLPYIGRLPVA